MQIQELNEFTRLFDIYGKLLSQKQYDVMFKHLNLDLSESELAEMENGTRQSIHDAIVKAKKQLIEFEEKCKLSQKNELLRENLLKLKDEVKGNLTQEKLIDEMINNL